LGDISKESAGLGNQKMPETPETILDPTKTRSDDKSVKDNSLSTISSNRSDLALNPVLGSYRFRKK
jgi:hypothetical protein